MIGKTVYVTILFLFSSLLLIPSWGELVDKVDLIRPLPVPVQGNVEVEGNVNVVNTPEVIVRDMPEVIMAGDVNVTNSPEVIIAGVPEILVINEKGNSIPVQITNPLTAFGRSDPKNFFSWHRHSSLSTKKKTRTHSAISVSKMAGRPFVLTDVVATARFHAPDSELVLGLKGSGADRGLGIDFILVPASPQLVSHFETGILFNPDVAINVSARGAGQGRELAVEYSITFSGYFLP
jgi:hypothetical protein